ncbi:MAG: CBS domain-containing protein [Deltaproteobacteria bacterium]|nr:CBS domain-containing protein [Deltaproteobacteria bacterium]
MPLPLLPVAHFMSHPVHTVHEANDVADVDQRMVAHGVSSLLVTDVHGNPRGVVSRFDLIRVGRLRARTSGGSTLLELPSQAVSRVMHRDVISVAADATVPQAAARMVDRGVHRVFVLDGARVVGVLSTRDVMRAVEAARIESPIEQWMSSPVIDVASTDPVEVATDRLGQSRVTGVVVLENGWPVGLYTQREALAASGLPPETPVDRVMTYALLCLPVETTVFRAAGLTAATRARRVLVVEKREVRGILTGLDFARVLLEADASSKPDAPAGRDVRT